METSSAGKVKDSAGAEETAGQEKKYAAAAEETLDIFETAREAQIKATTKLATDFRQMVNNPAFSDVAFTCTDGKQVHAIKFILAGRSDFLKSMLNVMAESNLCEINSGCSSIVLLSVFEFLYTGTLIDYLPKSWRTACEMIVAARHFLLTELEMIIRKFMQIQTDSVVGDLPKVASLLTEAVCFEALCDPKDVTLRVLVKILVSNLSNSTFIQILSENAFHYFLANSKDKCEDLDKLSFREYLRFRQVIRWWVHQCDLKSCGTDELVNFIAPGLEKALLICRNQGSLEVIGSRKDESEGKIKEESEVDPPSLSKEWNSLSLQLNEAFLASRNAAIRLLSEIDYRCIHPALLAEVVEPLKISSTKVMSAFRFHALRRATVFKTLEWEHGESYRTFAHGYVIRRTGTGNESATAVMNDAMSLPCGLFQWSVTLDELSEAVLQLGFICTNNSKGALKPKLADVSPWWALFRGSDYVSTGATKDTLKNCIKANSPTLFSFNSFKHTCSLSLIGQILTWSKLPSGIYYPAVKLDPSFKGHLRIELLSGFDILGIATLGSLRSSSW